MWTFFNYFDPHERRLVMQWVVIGVVVWAVVYGLKTAVHELSHIGWVDRGGQSDIPRVRLSADAGRPLNEGDILVVIGLEEALDGLEKRMRREKSYEKVKRDREAGG